MLLLVPDADVEPLAAEPLLLDPLVPLVPLVLPPLPVLMPLADKGIRHPVAVTLPPLLLLLLLLPPVCPVLPAPLCADPSAAVMQMPITTAPLPMNFRFMMILSSSRRNSKRLGPRAALLRSTSRLQGPHHISAVARRERAIEVGACATRAASRTFSPRTVIELVAPCSTRHQPV